MADRDTDPAGARWHVDRRVPVALIISMFVGFGGQLVGFGWWMADLNSRIVTLERVADGTPGVLDRLARIEVRQEQSREDIRQMSGDIRTIRDRLMRPETTGTVR